MSHNESHSEECH